ncbi:MAG: hypothetical protein ACE5KI_06940, partial [Dehalococcoidia bacterium]
MWDLFDILEVAVLWIHAASAVLWIGGSLFYLMVLRPALRDADKGGGLGSSRIATLASLHFREWVHLSMVALLVSGAILTFDRLTEPSISGTYIGALVAKIAIAFWLFGIGTVTYRKRVLEQPTPQPPREGTGGPLLKRWLRPLVSPNMI